MYWMEQQRLCNSDSSSIATTSLHRVSRYQDLILQSSIAIAVFLIPLVPCMHILILFLLFFSVQSRTRDSIRGLVFSPSVGSSIGPSVHGSPRVKKCKRALCACKCCVRVCTRPRYLLNLVFSFLTFLSLSPYVFSWVHFSFATSFILTKST